MWSLFEVLFISLDLLLLSFKFCPQILGMNLAYEKNQILPLPMIMDTLVVWVAFKTTFFSLLLSFINLPYDQSTALYVTALSAINVCFEHCSPQFFKFNNMEASSNSRTDKLYKIVKYAFPVLVSGLMLNFSVQTGKLFVSNKKLSHLLNRGLGILGLGCISILTNLFWMDTESQKEDTPSLEQQPWCYWNQFHMPVVGLKETHALHYANKAATDFFSPLSSEQLSLFCERLKEADHYSENLMTHLDWLFVMLSDSSKANRQCISSVKEYQYQGPNLPGLNSRRLQNCEFQVGVFEVPFFSQKECCLMLVINEGVSASQHNEVKHNIKKNEMILKGLIGQISPCIAQSSQIVEQLCTTTDQSEIQLPKLKKIKSSELSLQEENLEIKQNLPNLKMNFLRAEANLNILKEILLPSMPLTDKFKDITLIKLLHQITELFSYDLKKKNVNLIINCEELWGSYPISLVCKGERERCFLVKSFLLIALKIAILHLDQTSHEIKLECGTCDKHSNFKVIYKKNNNLNLLQKEEDALLMLLCQEIGKRMMASINRIQKTYSEEEAKHSLEEQEIIHCNISLLGETIPVLRQESEIFEESAENLCFAEKVFQEQEKNVPVMDNVDKARNKIAKMGITESNESLLGNLKLPGLNAEMVSFGNIVSFSKEKIEAHTDILEEYEEGDTQINPAVFQRRYHFFDEQDIDPTKPIEEQGVFGILFVPQIILQERIVKQLEDEGITSIIHGNIREFLNFDFIFPPRATHIISFIDVCANDSSSIRFLKTFLASSNLSKYALVGIRCGSCPYCLHLKEEQAIQCHLNTILNLSENSGTVSWALHKVLLSQFRLYGFSSPLLYIPSNVLSNLIYNNGYCTKQNISSNNLWIYFLFLIIWYIYFILYNIRNYYIFYFNNIFNQL